MDPMDSFRSNLRTRAWTKRHSPYHPTPEGNPIIQAALVQELDKLMDEYNLREWEKDHRPRRQPKRGYAAYWAKTDGGHFGEYQKKLAEEKAKQMMKKRVGGLVGVKKRRADWKWSGGEYRERDEKGRFVREVKDALKFRKGNWSC